MTKDFRSIVFHFGIRGIAAAAIGLHRHLFTTGGDNGKLDFIKIGKFLSRTRSDERLTGTKVRIRHTLGNRLDRDIIKGNQQGQFMNGHILQHAFGIAFKALAQRVGCVGIVGDKGDAAAVFRGVLTGPAHVLADVLVVAHADGHAGGGGLVAHLFQFRYRGGAGFF